MSRTRPLSVRQAVIKRVEDLVLASIALVAALPALGLIALAIKLDSPGPVYSARNAWASMIRHSSSGSFGLCTMTWRIRVPFAKQREATLASRALVASCARPASTKFLNW